MVNNIVNKLNSINSYSKKIIIVISIVSFTLCIGGIAVITYNANNNSTLILNSIGSSMIYTAIVLFAQFVIGSLAIDFVNALINKNE